MSPKESALQSIRRMPDNVGYKEIADEVAFLAALHDAEDDIASGRLVSNADAARKLKDQLP